MRPPPVPLVPRHVSGRQRLGKARGFSLGELKKAGLQEGKARSSKIRIDKRRSTVHAHNVTSLSEFLASPSQTPSPSTPDTSLEVPAVILDAKEAGEPRKKRAKASRTKAAAKRKR